MSNLQFIVDYEQALMIETWAAEQNRLVAKRQNVEEDDVYYGAIGGELRYEFTPTSIGVILKVFHAGTENSIDVTDYANW